MKKETTTPTKQSYVEPVGFKGTAGAFDNMLHDNNVYCSGYVVANCYSSFVSPEKMKANTKLFTQSKEIAKALQDTVHTLEAWLKYVSDGYLNESYQNQKTIANSKTTLANAKQVLQEAGLTNE